jgi:O-6-methylguanine DNA methyltransferase
VELQEFVLVQHFPIVGWLELVVSGSGVRSITFLSAARKQRRSGRHPVMDELVGELDRYFSGKLKEFTVAPDPASGTPFQRRVWEELARIPYGETRSYRDVATGIGKPAAVRAVGMANHHNPIPIVVPCHRVIRTDGSLGGYGCGIEIKKALLELEGVRL